MGIRHITFACCIGLALLLSFSTTARFPMAEARASKGPPDWDEAGDEAVRILSGMLRIDTSNPPGNETRAAEYIRDILAREGIPSEIFELEQGRGNLVARLKGSGKKRPILLMGHTDVVGVEREKWSVDPFGGQVKDGYVYGRGAADDKGMTSVCLEVFLLLKRLNVPLERDVIFLAEAGEEGTAHVGIDFMVERHWDKIAAEFAINEGGLIYRRGGRVQYVGVATTEKVPRGIRLVARGTSGHGSVPRVDNPITHLAAAVAKVGQMQMPMRLNETTRAFFERLASTSPPHEAAVYRQLEDSKEGPAAEEKLSRMNSGYNSMVRTSIVPTIIKGGFRTNVIPGDAEATLDVRALPDEDIDALVERLRKLIDDPAVEVLPLSKHGRPATPPSSIETELFHALEQTQSELFPGAITVPLMLTGATDSAQLRAKGVQAYGLGSVVTDEERGRIHGNDERISVAGMSQFVQFLYHSVLAVAGAR